MRSWARSSAARSHPYVAPGGAAGGEFPAAAHGAGSCRGRPDRSEDLWRGRMKVRQHRAGKRRTWRKIHLAVDGPRRTSSASRSPPPTGATMRCSLSCSRRSRARVARFTTAPTIPRAAIAACRTWAPRQRFRPRRRGPLGTIIRADCHPSGDRRARARQLERRQPLPSAQPGREQRCSASSNWARAVL